MGGEKRDPNEDQNTDVAGEEQEDNLEDTGSADDPMDGDKK